MLVAVCAIGAAAVTMLTAGAAAGDSIFWGSYSGDALQVTSLDGGTVVSYGKGVAVSGTALDPAAGRVYWATEAAIVYANLSDISTPVSVVNATHATENGIRGIVVDHTGGKIYWANEAANKISWAVIDGTGGGDLNTTGAVVDGPSGVMLDRADNRIYWANGNANTSTNTLGYADLGGSGGGTLATHATPSQARGPVLDSATGTIYYDNFGANTIGWEKLDGSAGGTLGIDAGSAPVSPHGNALDPVTLRLYYANFDSTGNEIAWADVSDPTSVPVTTISSDAAGNALFPSLIEKPKKASGTLSVSGSAAAAGNTLSCDGTVTWKDDDVGALLYQAPATNPYEWLRDGSLIGGATASTYQVQEADLGHTVQCGIAATNYAGTTEVKSSAAAGLPTSERVFWGDYQAATIGVAELGGANATTLVTTGATIDHPNGVAVDAADGVVWWVNAQLNKISYANLDGSGNGHDLDVGTATVNDPWGIAVDSVGQKVYWANYGNSKISWAKMDGSGGGDITFSNPDVTVHDPSGVAVDHATGKIFWTNDNLSDHQVAWAKLDGSGGGTFDTTLVGGAAAGVAVDTTSGKVYWVNDHPAVMVAGLDGSNVTQLATTGASLESPYGIAVDHADGTVWWANYDNGTVSHAKLNGSGGGVDIATGGSPEFVALLGKPRVAAAAAVTGTRLAGNTFTCSAKWADTQASGMSRAPATTSYGWSRDGSTVDGATASTYATWAADGGHALACDASAANVAGTTNSTSADASLPAVTGRIYWSGYNGDLFGGTALGWAALNGSGGSNWPVVVLVDSPGGTAIDTAAGTIMWLDNGSHEIRYAALDGSSGVTSSLPDSATPGRGLVLDRAHGTVYWAYEAENVIVAMDTGGAHPAFALATNGATMGGPSGVAIDAVHGRIYWANGGDDTHPISSAKLDNSGGGADLNVSGATVSAARAPVLDVAGGKVYWANYGDNSIGWANLDGSGGGNLNTTGATLDGPHGLALDVATHALYVTNFSSDTISVVSTTGVGGYDLALGAATPSSPLFPALLEPPSAAGKPAITGKAVLDAVLTCSAGVWKGDDIGALEYRGPTTYAYQWLKDGSSIDGATDSTRTVQSSDVGHALSCRVTGTNLLGSDNETSSTATPTSVGAAAKLAFTSTGSSVASGETKTLTVQVRDAEDHVITSSSANVTFAKTAGTGTVSGTGTVAAASGVATKVVTGVLAGSVTVKATASGLTSASATFSVIPGAASKLVFTSGTANLAAGTARTLKAEVRDAAGNKVPTPSRSITFAKSAGAGTVTGAATVASASGLASLSVTAVKAGSITIRATASGLPTLTAGTTTFTIVPGPATKLVFTSSTAGLPVGQSRTLTVQIQDAQGNVVTSAAKTVSFSKTSGSGVVSGLGSVSSSSGVASKTVNAVTAGSITIKATASLLTAATTTFSVTAK